MSERILTVHIGKGDIEKLQQEMNSICVLVDETRIEFLQTTLNLVSVRGIRRDIAHLVTQIKELKGDKPWQITIHDHVELSIDTQRKIDMLNTTIDDDLGSDF